MQNQRSEVTQPTTQGDEVDVDNHDALEEESLRNLLALDPFLYTVCVLLFTHMSIIENTKSSLHLPYAMQSSTWQCTVTIARVQEGDSWWYPSCYRCGKSCAQQSGSYTCSKCGSTKT
jgi:predicted RNA-binding Zn-ribbon protein involved in translation (DUF1610 family)